MWQTAPMEDADLRHLLEGGDRRSIGQADAVARRIAGSAPGIAAAVRLMQDADPVVATRAADALEKATRADHDSLAPHKRTLLGGIAAISQQEVRWHLLQMLPRLRLDPAERAAAFALAEASLDHRSRIVAAYALSALFALSADDPVLRATAVAHAQARRSAPSAAIRTRVRQLLEGH